jgi:hypothetical protein
MCPQNAQKNRAKSAFSRCAGAKIGARSLYVRSVGGYVRQPVGR